MGSSSNAATAAAVDGDHHVLVPRTGALSYWELLQFTCLQGLANRTEPRVYCHYPEKSGEPLDGIDGERVFADWYRGYDGLSFDEVDPYELFDRLDPLPFDGYVLVDRRAPVTANVAANYASLENLLPVTPERLDDDRLPDLDVERDLRPPFDPPDGESIDFRAANRVEAYEWVYEHQWPDANDARIANLSTPDDGEDPPTNAFYTSNRSRDFTVAEGGVFFDLSSSRDDPDERALKDRVLAEMDEHGYVFGWHVARDEEHEHIRHLSEHGQLAIGASTVVYNFSFFSRVDVPGAVERFRDHARSVRDEVEPVSDTVYLTFVLSDGDSLNFLMRRAQGGQWLLDERGDIPFGWEMAPLLADLGPGILDYFQATATGNDHFVGGPSALAYVHPEAMADETLVRLLDATGPALRRTGLDALTVMKPGEWETDRVPDAYADRLGDVLTGVMQGYVRRSEEPRIERLYDDGETPLAWLPTAFPAWHQQPVDDVVADLHRLAADREQRPLFVPVHLPKGYRTLADAAEIADRLDPDVFEVVGPHAFYEAFSRSRPGTVVLEPPEGEAPGPTTLASGRRNELAPAVQAFGDERDVTVTASVTAEGREDAVAGDAGEVTAGPDPRRADLVAEVPDVTGDGRVVVEGDGDASRVSAPARFVEWPEEADPSVVRPLGTIEAQRSNHGVGTATTDAGAIDGVAWRLDAAGEDDESDPELTWGLFERDDAPAERAALFRCKADAAVESDAAVTVAATPDPAAGERVTRTLPDRVFDADEYRWVPLRFRREAPTQRRGNRCTRYHVGVGGEVDLSVDRIAVFGLPSD